MKPRTRRKPMADINVVPYIDVMLVLLVIFMITAPLLTQGVQVELPRTASEPLDRQQQEPLVVTVDVDGNFFISVGDHQDKPIDAQTLAARTAAVLRHKPGTPVMVRADDQVNYGRVVDAMSVLSNAGAPSVGLITRPLAE
ncbi:protein TolR [Endothiovibrio diazotrophicus]